MHGIARYQALQRDCGDEVARPAAAGSFRGSEGHAERVASTLAAAERISFDREPGMTPLAVLRKPRTHRADEVGQP